MFGLLRGGRWAWDDPVLNSTIICDCVASSVLDIRPEAAQKIGVNYVLAQMMFGDLSFEEASTSMQLLAREVMSVFTARVAV